LQPPDADVRGEPTQAGGHRDFTVPEVALVSHLQLDAPVVVGHSAAAVLALGWRLKTTRYGERVAADRVRLRDAEPKNPCL